MSLSLFFIPLNLSLCFHVYFISFGNELVFQVSTTVILVRGLTAASFLVDVFSSNFLPIDGSITCLFGVRSILSTINDDN